MKTLDPFIITLNNDLIALINSFSRAAPLDRHPPGVPKKVAPHQLAPAKHTPLMEMRPCLNHNPKMGVMCPRHKEGKCRFQHLDTNDPRQLKLFTDHQAVYKASGKGRGKGRGRGK